MLKLSSPNILVWHDHTNAAFAPLKQLCSNPVLKSQDVNHQFIIQTDASNLGVRAVLSQLDDKGKDRSIRLRLPAGNFGAKLFYY